MNNPSFVISIDCEMKWGTHQHLPQSYDKNFMNIEKIIEDTLDLFQQYGISATWAIVPLMISFSVDELVDSYPRTKSLDAIIKNKKLFDDMTINPQYYFIPSLLKMVNNTRFQSIGLHGYTHTQIDDQIMTLKVFDSELKASKEIFKKNNLSHPKSFIFPSNVIDNDYVEILSNNSIQIFRSASKDLSNNLVGRYFSRLNRKLDSYVQISSSKSGDIININNVASTTGTRFLRPVSNNLQLFFSVKRIKSEMLKFAQNGQCYHLWWHPHNFGKYTNLNFSMLREILTYYAFLRKTYGMKSLSMEGLYYENH